MLRRRDEAQRSQAASVVGLIDAVFENARVHTLDPRQPFAEAIAIRGRRVLAVGDRSRVRRAAGAGADRIDCGGRAVLPGLVDPHLHLFGLATRKDRLDCSRAENTAALLEIVRGRAASTLPGGWVRGEGVDETIPGGLPTAGDLERVAPGRLVRLRHRSRHASVLSRAALSRLRMVAPDVARRATAIGGLVSGHEDLVGALVGASDERDLVGGLRRLGRELAALGVTTVADATPRHRRELEPLVCAGVPQRVFAMRPWNGRRWCAGPRLFPGPVKILVDEVGSTLRPEPRVLAARIVAAALAGNAVAVHVVGSSTLVTVLDAFGRLSIRGRRRRHRLEHCAECPPPLVRRIAELGLAVVTNPAFLYWRGDVYRQETPGVARDWLYRARSLCAAGVRVAAASDAPIVPANPWIGMAAARDRRTRRGRPIGAGERVDARTALGFHTAHAGWTLGDDRIGRLIENGPADLVVVEPDPLRASPDELRHTRVCITVADGCLAWPA